MVSVDIYIHAEWVHNWQHRRVPARQRKSWYADERHAVQIRHGVPRFPGWIMTQVIALSDNILRINRPGRRQEKKQDQ